MSQATINEAWARALSTPALIENLAKSVYPKRFTHDQRVALTKEAARRLELYYEDNGG